MKTALSSRLVRRRRWPLGLWATCWGIILSVGHAYVLEGILWPANQVIELDLQLGSPNGTLIDGSTSWDQVIAAATDIWNPYLSSGVQFATQETNYSPAQGDGKNSVFFASSVFGEGFGDDTLATTAYLYNTDTHVAAEADIVFNVAQSFNSYRGPLRANGAGPVYDLRRITLHELGHVLGLAHVPQNTQAIMTPDVTDIDTIQPDDIAGVESIYGNPGPVAPAIEGGLSTGGVVGEDFEYRIGGTNDPTSYEASGLPAGLSVDTVAGIIQGTPTAAGTYDVIIGATNSAGTGTAILHLVFGDTLTITSDPHSVAYVGKPYYYQIATTGQPTGFESDNGGLPAGLSLNQYTGLISGTPTAPGDYDLGVEAESSVGYADQAFKLVIAYDATLSLVENVGYISALLKGSDGNLYGTTTDGGANANGTLFKLTPDGTLTHLHNFGGVLYAPYNPVDLHQAADGSFYGTTAGGGSNLAGTVFRIQADGTTTTLANFPALPPDSGSSPHVLQATDGNYYCTVAPSPVGNAANPGGWVYKLSSGGTLTKLHTFNGNDGSYPSALIQAADGNFYGTTYQGGSSNLGTVFKITPAGALTTLHSFTSAEGTLPLAPLLQASDGNFYGTTSAGGAGHGTIFKLTADGTLTTIHTMMAGEGNSLTSALVQSSDSNFYGSASGYYTVPSTNGVNSILFKVTPDGTLTTLHTFIDYEGTPTSVPLIPDGGGNFYAVAAGPSGMDAVFKETPSAVPLVYAPPPVVIPTVTLTAAVSRAAISEGRPAEFMLSLSAVQDHDVVVGYTIKGSASNGTDYVQLTDTKTIKAGRLSKTIKIVPLGDLGGASKKTVVLILEPGSGYVAGTAGKVKVSILAGH